MSDGLNPAPAAQLAVKPLTLLVIVAGGLVVGTLIVLGAIMPAEYNKDPLGLGAISGISRLWAPDQAAWRTKAGGMPPASSSATPMTHNSFEIPLGPNDWKERELEYKVVLKPGQTILYKWTARNLDGTPATVPVEFDFHGEMTDPKTKKVTVAEYRKASALADTGSLTAPFEGIHGWYFKNHSPDPTIIHLEVTGFYALAPPGQPGNVYKVRPLEEPAAAKPN
jgi:hypothetical protein